MKSEMQQRKECVIEVLSAPGLREQDVETRRQKVAEALESRFGQDTTLLASEERLIQGLARTHRAGNGHGLDLRKDLLLRRCQRRVVVLQAKSLHKRRVVVLEAMSRHDLPALPVLLLQCQRRWLRLLWRSQTSRRSFRSAATQKVMPP